MEINIWIPLLSSIVGGSLVLLGQYIERNRKTKTEEINNLREIYAYCRKLEIQIKYDYKELAMAKSHVEYWWYCYQQHPSNDEIGKGYYSEHLRSQAFAREIENRLGDNKASYIAHTRKFEIIKEISPAIEQQLISISDLTNPKAIPFDVNLSHDEVRYQLADKMEKDLREEYYALLAPITFINNTIQAMLKNSH